MSICIPLSLDLRPTSSPVSYLPALLPPSQKPGAEGGRPLSSSPSGPRLEAQNKTGGWGRAERTKVGAFDPSQLGDRAPGLSPSHHGTRAPARETSLSSTLVTGPRGLGVQGVQALQPQGTKAGLTKRRERRKKSRAV